MSTQSIQELDERLAAILNDIAEVDERIDQQNRDSSEIASLHQRRNALISLAITLNRSIEGRQEKAVCGDVLALLKKELHEAGMESVISESAVGLSGIGTFTERWNHFQSAQKRWWKAIEALIEHRQNCPFCNEKR